MQFQAKRPKSFKSFKSLMNFSKRKYRKFFGNSEIFKNYRMKKTFFSVFPFIFRFFRCSL